MNLQAKECSSRWLRKDAAKDRDACLPVQDFKIMTHYYGPSEGEAIFWIPTQDRSDTFYYCYLQATQYVLLHSTFCL